MTMRELYEEAHGDYDEMLSRIPKENMVERFVVKFAGSDVFDRILEDYKNRDYKALFNSTHEFKGMSANMSFNALSAAVSDICEEVRHGEPEHDLAPMIERANIEYQLFMDAYLKYVA